MVISSNTEEEELAVHVGIKSVVPSSQPEHNDLLCSVQCVTAESMWSLI